MTNCYTYLIGWSVHDIWYYGCKYSKTADPAKLWKNYFTSSNHVTRFRDRHGEPDVIQVRATFGEDYVKCKLHEHKVIRRMKAVLSDRFLNKHDGSPKLHTARRSMRRAPKTAELMRATKIQRAVQKHGFRDTSHCVEEVQLAVDQYIQKYTIMRTTGLTEFVLDTLFPIITSAEYIKEARRRAPRRVVQSRKGIPRGIVAALDATTGVKLGMVRCDDPRWKTGEIKHHSAGRIASEATRRKISENHADVSGERNPSFGKHHSEATKFKIGNRPYKRGGNHPKAKSVSISGIVYTSITEAVCKLQIKESTLRDYLKGLYPTFAAAKGVFNPHYVGGGQQSQKERLSIE